MIDDGKLGNGGETSQEKEGEIENKENERPKETDIDSQIDR